MHHNSFPFIRSKVFEIKREGDIYVIRSINDEMYLQLVWKSTLSPFDEIFNCMILYTHSE